jgi:hypothetical protein
MSGAMMSARRTFSLLVCLGRGGFGEVYLAQMTTGAGPTRVAVKVLHGAHGQSLRRLRDEARALARLEHPAILQVHDLVELEGGRVALVTEYVEGEDLAACTLGLRALLEVLAQVAWALDAAWNSPLKLVHRDIKPSNIRISRHGAVKLLDFGIARAQALTREARTGADVLLGSPPYMAPERFLEQDPTPASDVFSLGCILLEALTGQRVFDLPMTGLAVLAVDPERYRAHLEHQLSLIPQGSPEPVLSLIRELLQHDPTQRPSARALAERLESLPLEGPTLAQYCRGRAWTSPMPDLSRRTLTEATPKRPPRTRWRWVIGLGLGSSLGGASLAAVALVVSLGLWRAWDEEPVVVPPVPGGNEEACRAYVQAHNALPCTDIKEDPRICLRLDQNPCDLREYYRCRAAREWCEGVFFREDWREPCPRWCESKRDAAMGPAERACTAYVEVLSTLACAHPEPATTVCDSKLDTMPCDWEAYYECMAEQAHCDLGRLSHEPGCQPHCEG